MSRITVVLAVCVLLALAQAGQAVTLEEGWYAKIQGVQVYTYGQYGEPQGSGLGYFYETPPSEYGPFLVTGGDPSRDYRRYVTVPSDVLDAQPEQSLILPLYIGLEQGTEIAYLELAWATNYDSNAMHLQLWRETYNGPDTLVWEQKLSGAQGNGECVAYDTILEGQYYFKLNVVPEPSGLAFVVVASGCLLSMMRRRRA